MVAVSLKKKKKAVKKTKPKKDDTHPRLEKCLREFYKLMDKEYLLKDIKDYDLRNHFDDIDILDFEVIVEDEFFDSLDIIPDGQYTKIPEFVDFIKNNK